MSLKFTVGCDPEFFLFDIKKGAHVSAHGMVPGTKKEPYKLKDGAVQLDGTAVEFNINPASTSEEFEHNINSVLSQIRAMIPERYRFSYTPFVVYEESYFKTLPKECLELGCEPDYSAYTGMVKQVPVLVGEDARMRTGSGHIHIGWTNGVKDPYNGDHYKDCIIIAKVLDKHFIESGLENVWCSPEEQQRRLRLYGNGGAFRPKPYGVEYRALSNKWLKYPKLYKVIGDTVLMKMSVLHNYGAEYGYRLTYRDSDKKRTLARDTLYDLNGARNYYPSGQHTKKHYPDIELGSYLGVK